MVRDCLAALAQHDVKLLLVDHMDALRWSGDVALREAVDALAHLSTADSLSLVVAGTRAVRDVVLSNARVGCRFRIIQLAQF